MRLALRLVKDDYSSIFAGVPIVTAPGDTVVDDLGICCSPPDQAQWICGNRRSLSSSLGWRLLLVEFDDADVVDTRDFSVTFWHPYPSGARLDGYNIWVHQLNVIREIEHDENERLADGAPVEV